jgi:mono/diheme cytochrome c family protein
MSVSGRRLSVKLAVRLCVWFCLVLPAAPPARAAFDPAASFNARCSGCHSVGHGVVVGPDLRGVTSRHDARWLRSFIRSSQGLVGRGDPEAVALFRQYNKKMPDHALADGEIDALLAYIAAGGPSAAARVRNAAEAGAAEIERGKALFTGEARLAGGGAACGLCHAAGAAARFESGTLASDLSRVYDRYQDAGLTRALAESHFPLMAASYRDRPLTADEIFALKAFLYQTARAPEPPAPQSSGGPLFLGLGSSPLALYFGRRVLRRRRRARRNRDRRSTGLDG